MTGRLGCFFVEFDRLYSTFFSSFLIASFFGSSFFISSFFLLFTAELLGSGGAFFSGIFYGIFSAAFSGPMLLF